MVSVIFLDVDGVVCCNLAGRLEENKLAQLSRIVRATCAKVVLSTDWRRQAQLKRQVVVALKKLNIEVIGATPMRPMFQPTRPMEIYDWFASNQDKESITSWVAIDDRDLLTEHGGAHLSGHFVRTHPSTGLTQRLADVCISILSTAPGGRPEAATSMQTVITLGDKSPASSTPLRRTLCTPLACRASRAIGTAGSAENASARKGPAPTALTRPANFAI